MERPRPTCPICGATDERSPDAFGVHSCAACTIEFRPPLRVPIRRARVNAQPNSEAVGWVLSLVIIGVLVGLAMAFGDHTASRSATLPSPVIEPYRPVVFDPKLFDARPHLDELQFEAPLARIPLEYELHRKQLADGELFATGLISAREPVEALRLEAHFRDLAGALLVVRHAVISCKSMQPGERCAWMIEDKLVGSVAEIELKPSGQRSLQIGPPQLDLRSERPGELDFNLEKKTVKFVVAERTLSEAWATVTAYSSEGRVLGVAETRYSGRHKPGRQRFVVAVPEAADEVGSYEVRVGGELSVIAPVEHPVAEPE